MGSFIHVELSAGEGELTIGQMLSAAKGFPSGFDYLRFSLAVSVVLWHSVCVSYGLAAEGPFWTGWPRPFIFAILPLFFGMGGFLVTASLQRNSIPAFLALRAARIYPALGCDVLVAALILGPLVTSYSLTEYFSHPQFWTYLLNMLGYIHFELPGVFHTNPAGSAVNNQLWTIPYEFVSYGAIAALAMVGAIRRRGWLLVIVSLLTAYATYKDFAQLGPGDGPPGRYLVLACLWGTVLYLWRDKIPHSPAAIALAVGAAFTTLQFPGTTCLSALPVVYIAVWLGTFNPPKMFPVAGTDFSYGIYVYGYPIQQTIAYLLPDQRVWYVNASLGVLFALLAAYLSWHLVEAPVLRRKNDIVAAADAASERMYGWLLGVRRSASLSRYLDQLESLVPDGVAAFFQSRPPKAGAGPGGGSEPAQRA